MDSRRRFGKYKVEREVLDEERLEELSQRKTYSDIHPPLTKQLKESFRCTVPKLKRSLVSSFPVLYWLPKYSVWDYGMPDLISGISVGIMHLHGVCTACFRATCVWTLLFSLSNINLLYFRNVPSYFDRYVSDFRETLLLHGHWVELKCPTSARLLPCSGTFTILSIMVGSVTERLAPDVNFTIRNGTNVTEEVDIATRDLYRVQVAAATTVLGGLIQLFLGVVKFGFVGTYLSEPLVRAYTTAAAAHAVVGQLRNISGVSAKRFSGPLSLIYTLVDVCSKLPQTHLPTLAVSAVTMTLLIAAKELNGFFSSKLPVPVPVELITIIAGTLISSYAHLRSNYSVSVVGEIPNGLQTPNVPSVSLFREVIGDAFALAVVGYAISISLGKTFALKHGYKVDSNQELVALGLSNVAGGFFQCFSVCASMSRSLIQVTTGGKTQMAGLASALIVLVTILKLGALFQELPKAVLASVVLVNLKGMFKQYSDIVTLWRTNKTDLVVWLVTWVSTMLLNLDLGLAASITFALFTVIFRTQLPTYSVLGNVPSTELYVDMETHREARQIPGVTIFRSSATVYFANAELYLEALKEKSGLDITKMILYKRQQEAKQKRGEKRAERRAKRQAKREVLFRRSSIFQDFSEIDVDIYLAGCQESVVEQLERGNFFSETITKGNLFASVHDAVLNWPHVSNVCTPKYTVFLNIHSYLQRTN
uniref:Solute carrier family 26 member 6, like 1 n=1 Tax=Oryzias sinensis TaxID=183150 RepID=A0A8C7YUV6_9TELE